MADGFRMPVEDLFHIRSQGYVFAGIVQSGYIKLGDSITIESPSYSVTTSVIGINKGKELVLDAKIGDDIGILVRKFHAEGVSDGIQFISKHKYRLISLTLTDPSPVSKPPRVPDIRPPWWQFWK